MSASRVVTAVCRVTCVALASAALGLFSLSPSIAQEGAGEPAKPQSWWLPKGQGENGQHISAEERQRIFEEEAKNLADNVSDEARRSAIEKILSAAGRHQATPLQQVLAQRAPEKAFRQLIALIVEETPTLPVHRKEFVAPLVRALPQVDAKLAKALREILTRESLAAATVVEVKSALESKDAGVALAGVEVAALRPDGTRGVVKLLDPLIELLTSPDENLSRRVALALRKATFIDLPDQASWRLWRRRFATDLDCAAAIADAVVLEAKRREAEVGALRGEILKDRLAAMEANEKADAKTLIKRLSESWPQIRAAAIGYLATLLPTLKGADADEVIAAFLARFEPESHENEANMSAIARALQTSPDPASKALLEGLAVVLRRNGLPSQVSVELFAAMRSADALPLLAELIEYKDHPPRPFGDTEQLALVKQLEDCAGGADAERHAASLATIYAALNARVARIPDANTTQAYLREVRSLLARLGLLVQYGRDVSAMTGGLLSAAKVENDLATLVLNVLSMNLTRNETSALAAIDGSAQACSVLSEMALTQLTTIPPASFRRQEQLINLIGRSKAHSAEIAGHWRVTLNDVLKIAKPDAPTLSLVAALAWGSFVASPEEDLSAGLSTLIEGHGVAVLTPLLTGIGYGPEKSNEVKAFESWLLRLKTTAAPLRLDFLALASGRWTSKEAEKAFGEYQAKIVQEVKASLDAILARDFQAEDGAAISKLLHAATAREIATTLISDLEKQNARGERRDALAKALVEALGAVSGLSLEGLVLEGEPDVFSAALKDAKSRLEKAKG